MLYGLGAAAAGYAASAATGVPELLFDGLAALALLAGSVSFLVAGLRSREELRP